MSAAAPERCLSTIDLNVPGASWRWLSLRPVVLKAISDLKGIMLSTPVGPCQGSAVKRRRASDSGFVPITPPASPDEQLSQETAPLSRAVHVLTTEAAALAFVARLYQTNADARGALAAAVDAVVSSQQGKGKLIVCGIGKSAYVGMKLVATLKSLGVACSFLHAAEAIHGDLGDVRSGDVILFVSFSGKTAELKAVKHHIPQQATVIAMTAHQDAPTCPLLEDRANAILLPAPIPESEESSFGVAAPTTSTTVAMAVGDMLALTVADIMHQGRSAIFFRKHHPGGTIGETSL